MDTSKCVRCGGEVTVISDTTKQWYEVAASRFPENPFTAARNTEIQTVLVECDSCDIVTEHCEYRPSSLTKKEEE